MRYRSGLATATCGLGVKSEGKLLISGTEGYVVVEAPWWKTGYFEVHHENPDDLEIIAGIMEQLKKEKEQGIKL